MDREYKIYWLSQKAMEQFNKALEEETAKWVTVQKPEASGPTGPSNIILDEMGQWDHTKPNYLGYSIWNKLPKLNNGNKKHRVL